ncbi:hypothetical protein HanIR_Chr05g0244031 [Helianthus annuus]|nr:hypothetical protein HanIR_Chr05g0244031 [Helianthus annuus]
MPIPTPQLPTWEFRQVRILLMKNFHPSLTKLGCDLFSFTWDVSCLLCFIKIFYPFHLPIDHLPIQHQILSFQNRIDLKFQPYQFFV